MFWHKRLFIFIVVYLSALHANSQDPGFSQIFSNILYLNPAYAGSPYYMRSRLVYRNQWLTANSPYTTYGVNFDRYFLNNNSGVGINIINDVQGQGAINRLSADFIYSYTVQVSYDLLLKGGIQAGGIFKSQNTSKLVFPDMIDPSGEIVGAPDFAGQSIVIPDFAAGIAGQWDFFYGGITVHHLAQPIENKYEHENIVLHRKYTFHAGCEINIYKRYLFRKSLILSPNIVYQQQQDFQQLNLGLYLSKQNMAIGMWLRQNISLASHTFVFLAGYHDEKYSFSYSYDFSIFKGGFRGINTSTHEVTFGKNFQYKTRTRKKIRTIKYPKI